VWSAFLQIEELCKKNNSQLILVVTPLFHREEQIVANYEESLKKFRDYATTKAIPFIDMGHDTIRFDKTKYADPAHLNKLGALEFTRRFYPRLMQFTNH